jgi:hypothetical protein
VEGLAAEAQRFDAGQVVCVPDLARRVLGDRALGVVREHPVPVVPHPDHGDPAILDVHLDMRSASV